MDTKRCAYCHKLQRADAQVCSRCGQVFLQKRPKFFLADVTHPSLLPASPHRVGHYSGLHPEDQPYQSSKILVQRPSPVEVEEKPGPQRSQHEPEQIELPAAKKMARSVRSPRMERWGAGIDTDVALEVTRPASYNQGEGNVPRPPQAFLPAPAKKPLLNEQTMSFVLTISCILFLLASSILAFTLINGRASVESPALAASSTVVHVHDTFLLTGNGFDPNDLLVFTHDYNETIFDANGRPLEMHTDSHGAFSIQISVPPHWSAGQHQIHVTDEAQQISVTMTITVQP